jgi:hypothetical protein
MTLREAYLAHGIDHVSASSLNTYVHEPALWLMERLLQKKAPVGAAAHRGTGIEAGVTVGLLYPDKPVHECQQLAIEAFDVEAAKNDGLTRDPKFDQERDAVKPTVAIALAELRRYGIPDRVQDRVDRVLDEDLPPLWGYLDYGWTRHGIIIDLKTQLRLASDVSDGHARQVAAYVYGTNYEGRICYATPKKCGVYVVEDVPLRFAELREIAIRLGRFLALSKDPQELAGLLVPDADHWMWNNQTAKDHRIEVYGL